MDGSRIAFIGASIGANVALAYAAGLNADVKTVVLLSPGEEYRGVNTVVPAKSYGKPAFYVASDRDAYAAKSVKKLAELAGNAAETKIYKGEEHGTNLLGRGHGLEELIYEWLKKHL
ncbi:MAG: alpha/beta hydrolase [Deltaproteobacteria bacterium]|nr:alpha/beta hydrolase [Deltaproteobacteria bacterium]